MLNHLLQNPWNREFMGMKIHEAPVKFIPKIQISETFNACSDDFKKDMNLWLLDKFGVNEISPIKKGEVFIMRDHGMAVMRPETATMFANIVT